MIVLDTETYNKIVGDIQQKNNFLSFDCKLFLEDKYKNVPIETLSSILSEEGRLKIREAHHKISSTIGIFLKDYETEVKVTQNHFILVNMSEKLKFSPVSLARLMIREKYSSTYTKTEINEFLKNPNLMDDPLFACNITNCLLNDILDGPLTDVIRRCVGEEYEIRLKTMARQAGLCFFDENDLRRTGFDKTPDLKLAVPCLFRGTVIHWIESKALFGSYKTHQKYVKEQLESYSNRFGSGMVLYWHGYQDIVANCKENGSLIVVSESFPKQYELEFLNFNTI